MLVTIICRCTPFIYISDYIRTIVVALTFSLSVIRFVFFRAAGGGLVDATPQVQAKFQGELDRVQKSFGAVAGEDFTKFPTFNFQGERAASSIPCNNFRSLCRLPSSYMEFNGQTR